MTQQSLFWHCPGCGFSHRVPITGPRAWTFSGTAEKPTLAPSVLCRTPYAGRPELVCHCFVRDGVIQFLADCTHALAGKSVPIEEPSIGSHAEAP